MSEKKLCPMRKRTERETDTSLEGVQNVNCEYFYECMGERCGWWVIDKCAIAEIAKAAHDFVFPIERRW